jgi:photosystem II stability/assembly factor-like uncharacterized protein
MLRNPPWLPLLLGAVLFGSAARAQSWEWQYPRPTGNTLYGVAFADSLVGCAVGAVGTIIRTTDGGENWEGIASGVTDDLHAIVFANPRQGWIASGGGT